VYTRVVKKCVHRLTKRKSKREEDETEGRVGKKRVHKSSEARRR
jgi:hypothetical protein